MHCRQQHKETLNGTTDCAQINGRRSEWKKEEGKDRERATKRGTIIRAKLDLCCLGWKNGDWKRYQLTMTHSATVKVAPVVAVVPLDGVVAAGELHSIGQCTADNKVSGKSPRGKGKHTPSGRVTAVRQFSIFFSFTLPSLPRNLHKVGFCCTSATTATDERGECLFKFCRIRTDLDLAKNSW